MDCSNRVVTCTTDINHCIVCPPLPAIPEVLPTYTNIPNAGWNAGANSIAMLDGDLYTQFGLPTECAGIVIGFKAFRAWATVPTLVAFGLYLSNAGGHQYVNVIENGVNMTAPVLCASSDVFTIGRYGGVVGYKRNSTLLYQSSVTSAGPLIVNACLYASGDEVA
ncbi:hypothetical protein [Dokdonella soli]|uniref:Uncharacterized protein n=1 Tax=Dokdonella soli TaxID=529810 RepID=A0ABN1ITW6_9GAMM